MGHMLTSTARGLHCAPCGATLTDADELAGDCRPAGFTYRNRHTGDLLQLEAPITTAHALWRPTHRALCGEWVESYRLTSGLEGRDGTTLAAPVHWERVTVDGTPDDWHRASCTDCQSILAGTHGATA